MTDPSSEIEERSWYHNGWMSVRREDVSLKLWVMLPYRRIVGTWERRS